MKLQIPELSLVALIGVTGSGKSTFAKKHFQPFEVISSDFCRGLVSNEENNQAATKDAFEVLNYIAGKRLKNGLLTVIDATNVQHGARQSLVTLAREHHVLPVAIVFNLPEKISIERNKSRLDRDFGDYVIHQQADQLKRGLKGLKREGFRHIYTFNILEEVESAEIERHPLWTNLKQEHGPFDIIGDVHGCFDELQTLLQQLGYKVQKEGEHYKVSHPDARKVIFLGDIIDRGPKVIDVLSLVMDMVEGGTAVCVPGNHEDKLLRKLKDRPVQVTHGLEETVKQLEETSPEFKERVKVFIDKLISHFVLDDGKLVVAHAGMKEEMQGRGSGRVRDFALYGETTGETDEYGLPVRYPWARDYRGKAIVVYGHTPVVEPEWINNTIDIDTGCVFGGKLTALRYPEKELVSVPSAKEYYTPAKPLTPVVEQREDDILDIQDVLGKRIIATRLRNNVTVREENAIAALEVMSRFAVDPKWLIYLPPTMSPTETSKEPGLLEHPQEAFDYYQKHGVSEIICEQKHMGSRAIVIVCKNEEAAQKRFGIAGKEIGICYTRTGRRFFEDKNLEWEFLARIQTALEKADIWNEFKTDWVCFDCELLPWSAKAQELIKDQYAAVGASGKVALTEAVKLLEQGISQKPKLKDLLNKYKERENAVEKYILAYQQYSWPVRSLKDIKLAPFHFLATEGKVHIDKSHVWHMQTIARVCEFDSELLLATPYKTVELGNKASEQEAIDWWTQLTGDGGEGIVVKPSEYATQDQNGLLQPAIKCRGKEYLRIIYSPEYTLPENIERLLNRNIAAKRSLALREFALGVEGLERFIKNEPLYKIHECAFAVLALESEPVDPRL